MRGQLELVRPFASLENIETARAVQDRLGRLLRFTNRHKVALHETTLGGVRAAMVIPRDELRTGLIFYLHGGGYTSGTLDYALGFASTLSAECGMRVACIEYSLAPENPFPKALFESVDAYRALLDLGYSPESIILAGESAGGGLCYSLALKLKELDLPRPSGIIAISPWCDLTLSGESYELNRRRDPSLKRAEIEAFLNNYLENSPLGSVEELKKNPLVSPVFADLSKMPPSLIFAGGDEILRSDAEMLNERLISHGSESTLTVKAGMWHAYHLYSLKSADEDFKNINAFIKRVLPLGSERKLRWMQLDNSAKIYPAVATANWTNVFRLSATLTEPVEREILKSALDVTVRRFPSIAVKLRRGTFWYYFEEIRHAPELSEEKAFPLSKMSFKEIRRCAFRVIAYKNRVAVEFFHAVTDGCGGMVFLKSLLAEYVEEKYGVSIPNENGILDRLSEIRDGELEDSFFRFSGNLPISRKEPDSYRIFGTPTKDGFRHLTTFVMDANLIRKKAKEIGVTVTAYLAAAVIKAGIALQNLDCPYARRQKPVKLLIPVDLRRLYGSETLRNFALYATPGIDTRLGEYSFSEIARLVYHQMSVEINKNYMSGKIKTNIKDELNPLLKIVPLFLKNAVMRLVFSMYGEKKTMLSLSNIGVVELPEQMKKFVSHFDFVLSVQSNAPYNIGTLSYDGKMRLSVTRNIEEARLESELYRVLRDEGVGVLLESNQR